MKLDLDALDRHIAAFMRHWGTIALRVSLGVIFVWFGLLKSFGLSPAEPLVKATVQWLPVLDPGLWVAVIGWWEVAIGVTFLVPVTVRVAIALLALQMVGTFMPLVLLPQVTFQPGGVPHALTMEGQYIVKEPGDHRGRTGDRRDGPAAAAPGHEVGPDGRARRRQPAATRPRRRKGTPVSRVRSHSRRSVAPSRR